MTSYTYQPLHLPHETRILTLLPGEDTDSLKCSLSPMSLEAGEVYDCLSYCWSKSVTREPDMEVGVMVSVNGEDDEPRLVRVGDLLDEQVFDFVYVRHGGILPNAKIDCDGAEMTIGGELSRALRRIREKEEPLRIWVDALCINQLDVVERNEHVKMMQKVYAGAKMVHIWLGDRCGEEEAAFEAFNTLHGILNRFGDGNRDSSRALMSMDPRWYKIEWDAIAQFIGRAWVTALSQHCQFERIWVVQEVANAKNAMVYAGHAQIAWNSLFYLIFSLRKYSMDEIIPHHFATGAIFVMGSLRQDRLRGELRIPFLTLLEKLRHFKSTIASDKIYGVVSLMPSSEQVDVDYNKSPEQVFTDLAVQHLEKGSINILYHCYASSYPAKLDLPSWVPDWTRPGWADPLFIRGLECAATQKTKPEMDINTNTRELHVKGRLLDTVLDIDLETAIPAFTFNHEWSASNPIEPKARTKAHYMTSQRHVYEQWKNMLAVAWPEGSLPDPQRYENLWRTFMCNRTRDNEIVGEDDNYGCAWEEVIEALAKIVLPDENPLERIFQPPFVYANEIFFRKTLGTGLSSTALRVRSAHFRWCIHRRFFVSEDDRFGWAVDGTLPGDKIAVFYGCDYPFIIREEGEEKYRIIGDCYIHGLMDGEALDDEFEDREIVLV